MHVLTFTLHVHWWLVIEHIHPLVVVLHVILLDMFL